MLVTEIQDLLVLHCVSRQGSYSKAAEELGISPSRVSRVVSGLEERLGVRLIQRTTRKLALTEAGSAFCDQTRSLLSELEEAETEVQTGGSALRGHIRVSLPTVFGKWFSVMLLGEFAKFFPDLKLDLELMDRYADLEEDGVDVAVRVGPVNDPRLTAQRLCTNRRVLVASPAYVERHGQPRTVQELQAHHCILFDGFENPGAWWLAGPDGERQVSVSGRIASNNMQVLARCAVDGLGIAPGPTMAVGRYLASGELLRVLPEYEFQPVAVFAVYLSGCKTSTKVRSLVGFLEQRLHDPPPWDQVLLQRGLLPDKYGQVL